MSVSATSYAFDNDDDAAVDRHSHLPAILDVVTLPRLASLGDLTGRRCLELGAGGGSVARWLAGRVGPAGRVLATDLNTRHLPVDEGYEVLAHDLLAEPVPRGPWDLIHARLVLIHLDRRREVLRRLADALAPGGALVVEDWDTSYDRWVLDAPDAESAALWEEYQLTLRRLLVAGGNEETWGVNLHALMRAAGLVDVDTEISSRSWPGGTPGALLTVANVAQMRAGFRAEGWDDERLERLERLCYDPRMVVRAQFMYSVVGRRPGPGAA